MTQQQAFFLVSGIIFGLVALLHAVRLALRWLVKVNQREVPMGLSIGGLIIAAGLCVWALRLLL